MSIQALVITLLTIFALVIGSVDVFAVNTPNFPTCSNPQGTIKVSYNEGTHGIAGDTKEYTGSDTVYQLDSNNLQQCFCSENGQGIQTNWWKISSLDQEQIQLLKNSGWVYIPNGALWGLDETPYMAKNSEYACENGNNGGNTGGSGGDGLSDGLGCATHDCSNQVQQQGEVLGLAFTGNSLSFYGSAILGIIFLSLGFYLYKKSR